MSQNQQTEMEKWFNECFETLFCGVRDIGGVLVDIAGRALTDIRIIAKTKPTDLIGLAIFAALSFLIYTFIFEYPVSRLIGAIIHWKWLAGLLIAYHKSVLIIAGTLFALRALASRATKEQRAWQSAFNRLGLKLNNLAPTFIESRSLESGGKEVRFYSNGLCAGDLIKKQAALSQIIREKITAIEDCISAGELRIRIAGHEVPKSITVLSAMQAATRPSKWDLVFGLSEDGYVVRSLIELPHLLVAGATGSGKSTALKSILFQLLCSEGYPKLVIIDTKDMDFHAFSRVEEVIYINTREGARVALTDLVELMQIRQKQIVKTGCQNFDQAAGTEGCPEARIIIVVDEFTDLIKPPLYEEGSEERSRQILASIEAIGRLGRASGMYLILSTQLPDRSILNSLTRANFPAKLCFALPNIADSLAILGNGQAAQLSHTPGRAIYQEGARHFILQSPTITNELTEGYYLHRDREKPLDNVKSLLPVRVVKDKETLFGSEKKEERS